MGSPFLYHVLLHSTAQHDQFWPSEKKLDSTLDPMDADVPFLKYSLHSTGTSRAYTDHAILSVLLAGGPLQGLPFPVLSVQYSTASLLDQ